MDDEPMDVASQMAVENGFEKFVDFTFFTLNLEFDPTIDQVLHRSDHVVPGRDRFDGISGSQLPGRVLRIKLALRP